MTAAGNSRILGDAGCRLRVTQTASWKRVSGRARGGERLGGHGTDYPIAPKAGKRSRSQNEKSEILPVIIAPPIAIIATPATV